MKEDEANRNTEGDGGELARLLDQMGEDEQAVITEALKLDDAPGVDQVSSVLEREWAVDSADTPARSGGMLFMRSIVSIAAMLLIAFAVWQFAKQETVDPGAGPSGVTLGSDSMEILHPLDSAEGEVASWDAIEWTPLANARIYELIVSRESDDEELLNKKLVETRINLTELDTSQWGDSVFISVRALGDSPDDALDVLIWQAKKKQ